MANNFIPGLRQTNNIVLRRRRELPIKGRILVKKDEIVRPDTQVARAELPGDIQIIRIAESMGIEPEDVASGLLVSAGAIVKKGDLLCEHRGLFGLFKSQYRAPSDGKIDFISEALGHVGLRQASQILSLNAYCGGKVVGLTDNFGVEIETHATIVQGIFGVGGERLGKIHLLNCEAGQMLSKEHLPTDFKGAILIGGTLPDIEVLELIAAGQASGLVVGGIDDLALKEFLGFDIGLAITGNENISFSLMVTEGFGNLAISQRVLDLIKPHQAAFACMNGTTQIRAGAIRPEIIIPTTGSYEVKYDKGVEGLAVGAKVRLIRVPFFGELGEVLDLPSKPEQLESGTIARVLKVKLNSGRNVTVPRANAEIIL